MKPGQDVFNFGFDIIIKDISKITSLKNDTVNNILCNTQFEDEILETSLVEKELFKNEIYRKIKKKLIYEIAKARIEEVVSIILFNNINFNHFKKTSKVLFFEFNSELKIDCIKNLYKTAFSQKDSLEIKFQEIFSIENTLKTANKISNFGWKKEVIPIAESKKSLIVRFFDAIFG